MTKTETKERIRNITGDEKSILKYIFFKQPSSKKNYTGLKNAAENFIRHLMNALYPFHLGRYEKGISVERKSLREIRLAKMSLRHSLGYVCGKDSAENLANVFFSKLPCLKALIETDIQAAYEGDPAAKSIDEVILTYPAFLAITAYRFAHEIYMLKVPLLPRLITEYAHSLTGIDIHPGAMIGGYFFIDHGTGVVIGETTVIGEHVKLYQQVTLGAKSFELGPDGKAVKGIKRHPEIGDYVVIYAGATILGGNTHIGHHCIIGGNVWLTHSVEPYNTVTVQICENKTDGMKEPFQE